MKPKKPLQPLCCTQALGDGDPQVREAAVEVLSKADAEVFEECQGRDMPRSVS